MTKVSSKIEFANSLRGIAVLLVLLGHYVLVFNALKGGYVNFPQLEQYPFPGVAEIFSWGPLAHLNIGPMGVAIFFLVSGLVIPNSPASLANKPNGRTAFVIGRMFRIWPTYAVGVLISVYALWINSQLNEQLFYQPWDRVLSTISMFRDWLGQAPFDGVVWTLEVEAKFYVFIMLFWSAFGAARLYPIFVLGIVALLASGISAPYDATIAPTVGAANFTWFFPYLVFMSIGICFNYHFREKLKAPQLALMTVSLFSLFSYLGYAQDFHYTTTVTYGVALSVFAILYFFARTWTGGPIIKFFADISFPMYACHAALGYTGMSYMTHSGLNPWISLIIQVSATTTLATVMHYLIEIPTHNVGKALGTFVLKIKGPGRSAEAK